MSNHDHQYNLSGVNESLELGQDGVTLDATSKTELQIQDTAGDLCAVHAGDATSPTHLATLQQVSDAGVNVTGSMRCISVDTTYPSSYTNLGTLPANSLVEEVIVQVSSTNDESVLSLTDPLETKVFLPNDIVNTGYEGLYINKPLLTVTEETQLFLRGAYTTNTAGLKVLVKYVVL